MIKVGLADLKIGIPVPWDAYDATGKLLIRKGFVLESLHQVEVLVKQGLYVVGESQKPPVKRTPPAPEAPKTSLAAAISVLTRELKNQSHLVKLIREKNQHSDLQGQYIASVRNIITAVQRQRDLSLAYVFFNKTTENYPLRHSLDTAIIAIVIATALDKRPYDIFNIASASLTMNISMLKLQAQLLGKAEALSQEEITRIRRHPAASRALLEQVGINNSDWLDYVLCHHEKNDGSGYPRGLQQDDIPEGAQIICLADRYTATLSPRSYRPGLLPNQVLRELLINQKDTLNLGHAGVLTKVIGIYPPGMFVKLRNGETAVVIAKGEDGACPLVKSILGPDNTPLPFPITRDTRGGPLRITGAVRLEPEQVTFDMVKIWGEAGQTH